MAEGTGDIERLSADWLNSPSVNIAYSKNLARVDRWHCCQQEGPRVRSLAESKSQWVVNSVQGTPTAINSGMEMPCGTAGRKQFLVESTIRVSPLGQGQGPAGEG